MKAADIIKLRLSNQQIANTKFKRPEEIVHWLGAVQAQEFAMAKWALGLRLKNVAENVIENSFNEGKILRTHLLRPTWHFVSPFDIRWMLSLTAPRVHAANKYYYKKFELDSGVFKRANAVLVKNLRDEKMLTRNILNKALSRAKIKADGLRLSYIFMQAELEGIICSGPRNGNQFTYALLEERVPPAKPMHPEESLAELSKRYFTSRGPATAQDFAYWSGLTFKQVSAGIAMLDQNFVHEKIDDRNYILNPSYAEADKLQTTFLMPDYDEYGMSYKDKSALSDKKGGALNGSHDVTPYSHMLIVEGTIAGTWKAIDHKSGDIEVKPFWAISKKKQQAIRQATKKYKTFLTP